MELPTDSNQITPDATENAETDPGQAKGFAPGTNVAGRRCRPEATSATTARNIKVRLLSASGQQKCIVRMTTKGPSNFPFRASPLVLPAALLADLGTWKITVRRMACPREKDVPGDMVRFQPPRA